MKRCEKKKGFPVIVPSVLYPNQGKESMAEIGFHRSLCLFSQILQEARTFFL